MDFGASVLAGIVSGLIASLVFLTATRFLRPKILISKQFAVYPSDNNDGKETVRLKVVNLRRRAASDVVVAVYAEHKRIVHGGPVKVRKSIGYNFTTHTITKRKFRDKEYDNARRIRIDYRDLVEALANPEKYLIVEVYARDAISGVGEIFTQEYALAVDKFVFGSFELGNGTNIIPRQEDDTTRFALPRRIAAAKIGTPDAWKI